MRQSDVCGQSEIYNLIKVRPKFHLALCYVCLPLVKRSNATPIRSRSGDLLSPTNQLIVYKMFGAPVGCVKLKMAASMTPRKKQLHKHMLPVWIFFYRNSETAVKKLSKLKLRLSEEEGAAIFQVKIIPDNTDGVCTKCFLKVGKLLITVRRLQL